MSLEVDLMHHPFSRDFPPSVLSRLAPLATRVEYKVGEAILKEGEAADRFLLITDGKVIVEIHSHDQGRIPIQTLGPGQVAGWSWFLEPHLGTFDLLCLQAVGGLEFKGERLRALMEQDHEVGYAVSKSLVKVVADRLSATRLQVLDLYAPGGRR